MKEEFLLSSIALMFYKDDNAVNSISSYFY